MTATDSNAKDWSEAARNYAGFITKATGEAADGLLDLVQTVRPLSNDSVILDSGAGTGELTRHVLSRCPDASITAADIAPGMLEILKSSMTEHPKVQIQVLDATKDHVQQNMHPDSFTHALSSFMHQFIPAASESIKFTHQVLQPGGVLGIAIWQENEVMEPWNRACKNLDPSFEPSGGFNKGGPFAVWRTTEDMEGAFKAAGFEDVKSSVLPLKLSAGGPEESADYWLHAKNPISTKAIAQWKGNPMDVRDELVKVFREEFENGTIKMLAAFTVGKKPAV